MLHQIIKIGTTVNDRSGDPLRTAFQKINNNFNDLYNVVTGNNVATYNLLTTDQYFGTIYSTTGPTSVILPLGSSVFIGKTYTIKDEGGNSQNIAFRVSILTSGADKIDGGTSASILTNYGVMRVIWTGTVWSII